MIFSGSQRRLMWHGMLLFLLGLLLGLAEGQVTNPRMGLAAHLEGLMNGTYLIALGAIWPFVKLSPKLTTLTFWTVLYGTYSNLIVTTVAAVVGANSMSPITGAGHSASAWQEILVSSGFVTVGVTMLVSSVLSCGDCVGTLWLGANAGTPRDDLNPPFLCYIVSMAFPRTNDPD